ncbi:hypothetical protein PVK06_023048 [Gossypium arboreum]|uniref:Uncharacterized protein n=1 Tax=Gossypium arboreum TaxID=29729 RepID=A0ABR0PA75_GOSAR|nr:hypothetical protein PVK06_023048 [Gossypium arboreum]
MKKPDVVDIDGCLVLLHSWALYRMSFLASSSGTTGIEHYDSLVASSIPQICQCRWGRYTTSTRKENMEVIGGCVPKIYCGLG